MQIQLQCKESMHIQCKSYISPCPSVWPLVGISKHWRENSTLLAYNQKPQPQLGQNVQALRRGLRQNLQPWGLAGPPGRPRPKVAISVKVQASVLGQIVPALAMAPEWKPTILNLLACPRKLWLAQKSINIRDSEATTLEATKNQNNKLENWVGAGRPLPHAHSLTLDFFLDVWISTVYENFDSSWQLSIMTIFGDFDNFEILVIASSRSQPVSSQSI